MAERARFASTGMIGGLVGIWLASVLPQATESQS
jgi:hypothetical protein